MTSYRERRLQERLQDAEFRAEYERMQREIAQVDARGGPDDPCECDPGECDPGECDKEGGDNTPDE